VNNAIVQLPGMMNRVLDTSLETLAQVLQGNVVAQVALVQRVLPGMLARRRGAIVNLVSASGAMDPPAPTGEGGWSFAYAASKAALMRLSGVLSVEHRDAGVRFFDVEPGFVLTESMRQSALRDGFAARFGGAPPEVPAAVVAWLLTDPAALDWHGRTVSAQKLCKQLRLLPGWPPARA
jgi:NAD(P)-dependent dehydrogenase (short-subunit alcohol dehydrogenase family)